DEGDRCIAAPGSTATLASRRARPAVPQGHRGGRSRLRLRRRRDGKADRLMPLRWQVVEADLDPGRGSEQRGIRPVLIVSNDDFHQAISNVTVLPLTSARRELYPAEV